jgi:hypothetical protein
LNIFVRGFGAAERPGGLGIAKLHKIVHNEGAGERPAHLEKS